MTRAAIGALLIGAILLGALAAGSPVVDDRNVASSTAGISLSTPANPQVGSRAHQAAAEIPTHAGTLGVVLGAVAVHLALPFLRHEPRFVLPWPASTRGLRRRGPPAFS